MNASSWIWIDNGIYGLQILLVLIYWTYATKKNGAFVGAALAFTSLLFISPLFIITYRYAVDADDPKFFRFLGWHQKFGELFGAFDVALMAFAFWASLRLLKRMRSSRPLLKLMVGMGIFMAMGILSMRNNQADHYWAGVAYSIRGFLALLIGVEVGYDTAMQDRGLEWLLNFLKLNALNCVLGAMSLMMLNPGQRWVRYEVSNWYPSQYFAFISALCGIMVFASQVSKLRWKILFLVVFILPLANLYKSAVGISALVLVLPIACWLFKRYRALVTFTGISTAIWVAAGTFLASTFAYYVLEIDKDATATRFVQCKNVTLTLMDSRGAFLFGVGWRQPYVVHSAFTFFDTGAWGDEDMLEEDLKINIQAPPFSVLRSIGFVGGGCYLAFMFYIWWVGFQKVRRAYGPYLACGFTCISLQILSNLGEGSPEGVTVCWMVAAFPYFLPASSAATSSPTQATKRLSPLLRAVNQRLEGSPA